MNQSRISKIPESRDDNRRQALTRKEIAGARVLDQRLREAGEKATKELEKRGKYKIQVWFKSHRSIWKPMAYTVSIWESGKRLHGGGDEMMFFCKRQPQGKKAQAQPFGLAGAKSVATPDGCGGLIPGDLSLGSLIVCPHCHTKWETTDIGDSVYYFTTAQKAGEVLEFWWRKLNCDADIYAKYRPDDPRTVMMSRNFNAKTAREKKGLTIYPMGNILRDSMGGTVEVQQLFKTFITA